MCAKLLPVTEMILRRCFQLWRADSMRVHFRNCQLPIVFLVMPGGNMVKNKIFRRITNKGECNHETKDTGLAEFSLLSQPAY